jgi:hypothetical protein
MYKTKGWGWLLIPWSCVSNVSIVSLIVDQNDAEATFSGSDCFVPQHWEIKITGCIKLRDEVDVWSLTQWNLFGNPNLSFASLYPIHEKCRAAHFWSHDLVDFMVWSPREGPIFGIRLFSAPALGDQNYRMYKSKGWGWLLIPDSVELIWKPISSFSEFIPDSFKVSRRPLLIPWSCGSHGLIPTRRPHFRDQIGFCPSIGGSKLRDVQNYGIRLMFDPRLIGTYLETHIFELRVHPDSSNVHIASTL